MQERNEEQLVNTETGEIIDTSFRSGTAVRKREADTAEPFSITTKLIETGWERRKLFSGDYWFMTYEFETFGITRKTTDDLLNSIFLSDKHAKNMGKRPFVVQLEEMLDYYKYNKMLIEGSWKQILGDDITRKHVQNFLDGWQTRGFTLELSSNEEMTVKRLNEIYAKYQQPYSKLPNSKEYLDDRVLCFPSGCRGKTAMDCLVMFGSIEMICKASVDDLMHVNNIGLKKANLIWNHFHKGYEQEVKREYIQERVEEIQQTKLGI